MKLFLRLKSWQLIFLAIGLPLLLTIGVKFLFGDKWSFYDLMSKLSMGIYYSVFMIWNFSVIRYFNKKTQILTVKQIRLTYLIIPIVFIYGIYLAFPVQLQEEYATFYRILAGSLPFGGFAIIYLSYCSAKLLKTIEHKDTVRTADIVIELFLILYFVIGIIWVQKRVNNLYKQEQYDY